jgi:hypothetical protein
MHTYADYLQTKTLSVHTLCRLNAHFNFQFARDMQCAQSMQILHLQTLCTRTNEETVVCTKHANTHYMQTICTLSVFLKV